MKFLTLLYFAEREGDRIIVWNLAMVRRSESGSGSGFCPGVHEIFIISEKFIGRCSWLHWNRNKGWFRTSNSNTYRLFWRYQNRIWLYWRGLQGPISFGSNSKEYVYLRYTLNFRTFRWKKIWKAKINFFKAIRTIYQQLMKQSRLFSRIKVIEIGTLAAPNQERFPFLISDILMK